MFNHIPVLLLRCLLSMPTAPVWALASANIPLDSPIYLYLD